MLSKITTTALACVLLVSLAACGSEDDGSSSPENSAASTSAPTSAAASEPTSESTSEPTTSALEDLDIPESICSLVTEDDVAGALGTTDTVTKTGVGVTGCAFEVADVTVTLGELYDALGLDATREGLDGLYGGGTTQLKGLAEPALIVVGTVKGGDAASAAGAVLRGEYVATMQVTQTAGLTAEALRPGTVRVLTMLADKG